MAGRLRRGAVGMAGFSNRRLPHLPSAEASICLARMRSSRVLVALVALVAVGTNVLNTGAAGAAGRTRSVSRDLATTVRSVRPGVPLEMVGQHGMPALVQVENVTVKFAGPASVNYKCSIILRRSDKVVGRGGFGGAVPGGEVSLPVELTIKNPFRGKPADARVRCIVEPAESITSPTAPPAAPTTTLAPNAPPATGPPDFGGWVRRDDAVVKPARARHQAEGLQLHGSGCQIARFVID